MASSETLSGKRNRAVDHGRLLPHRRLQSHPRPRHDPAATRPGRAGGTRRSELLDFLTQAFGDQATQVTIVFDAQHAPAGLAESQDHHGLHIRFAPKEQSADDLIETLIDEEAQPKSLDRHLQRHAACNTPPGNTERRPGRTRRCWIFWKKRQAAKTEAASSVDEKGGPYFAGRNETLAGGIRAAGKGPGVEGVFRSGSV